MKFCFQNRMEEGDPSWLGKIVYFVLYTQLKTQ